MPLEAYSPGTVTIELGVDPATTLVVELGTPGPQGIQGIQGIQGQQGIQGVKGDKGDQGIQGIQGDKGDKGDQGIQGIQGDKGDQGIQGIQGDKGDKGDQGIQGIQGDKGDQGIQGIQGDKGDKGDQGIQGIQGDKGDQGIQGERGLQGEQGIQGDAGVGVPVGGTAGQVLSKIDGEDYNTQWANPINPAEGFTLNNGASIDGSQGSATFANALLQTAIINGTTTIGGRIELQANGYVALENGSNLAYIIPTGLGLIGGSNITFSDNSIQTTAFIDAPSDGNQYARKDANWEQITNDIPAGGTAGQVLSKIDGTDYNTQWITPANPADGFTLNEGALINGAAGNASFGYLISNSSTIGDLTSATITFADGTSQTTAFVDAPSDGNKYARKDAGWEQITNGGGAWGSITGTLSSQTDLQNALDAKFNNPTGTTDQYIDGSGALQNFPTVTTAGKMVTSVRNNTGATLTKGTVVYINGAVGNKPTVAKAQANTEVSSKATFALVETNISNNADGNVVQIGLLENIDTQGFSDGTLIYLSPTVAGGWTSTQPYSPNHYVALGTVIRGNHPTQGSIQVRINNGFQLDEMSDVGAVSPTNNNVLTWNAATSQWLDKSISTILGFTPADDSLVLKKASNLSDLQSASTARTNLGLGSMATATATDYLDKAGNLSGLASASTARTNLGLGTASTLNTSAVLQTANNLSEVTPTTARTNLGLAYATTAETIAGTSSTTVVTPAGAKSLRYTKNGSEIDLTPYTWSSDFSVWTGVRSGMLFPINGSNSLAIGRGKWSIRNPLGTVGGYILGGGTGSTYGFVDWSKKVSLFGRFSLQQSSPIANNTTYFTYYLGTAPLNSQYILYNRGISIFCNYGPSQYGRLHLSYHNGSSLSIQLTSFQVDLVNGAFFEVLVEYDNGNVVCFVNGVNVGSISSTPIIQGTFSSDELGMSLYSTEVSSSPPKAFGSAFKVSYGY